MSTFCDHLITYNASDVVPFIEVLEKQKGYFKKEHCIHLFDHVSIAAISDRILQQKTPPGTWFSTLAKRDADLYESFNQALQGGKSYLQTTLHFQVPYQLFANLEFFW